MTSQWCQPSGALSRAALVLLLLSLGATAATRELGVQRAAVAEGAHVPALVSAGPCAGAATACTPALDPSQTDLPAQGGDNFLLHLTRRFLGKYIHHHKALLPLSWWDVAGFAASAAALVLAASGGIGGGGLLIPIYMLIFGFRTVTAVALSNFTIVGGTLANFYFNVGRRHPLRPGPLIDWDLILVMEPSTILGAIAGGYINHVLPPWLTTVSLAALLAFVTANLIRRGVATFHKESHQLLRAQGELAAPPSFAKLPDGEGGSGEEDGDVKARPRSPWVASQAIPVSSDVLAGAQGAAAAPEAANPELSAEVSGSLRELEEPLLGPGQSQSEGRPTLLGTHSWQARQDDWLVEVPLVKLGVLVALLVGVVASDTLRANLPCPSTGYWLAAVSMAPVTLLTLLAVRAYLIRKHSRPGPALHLAPVEGDVVWTNKNTLLYPALCTFAGLVAGLFGVGGGIVKGPLMLEMGVHPQTAAATSATMILFTSASASVVFISFGALLWDYAAVLFVIALVSTAAGQLATKSIIQRMQGRSSVIVFAMAAMMGASTLVLALQGVLVSREAFSQHHAWDWGSVCSAAS